MTHNLFAEKISFSANSMNGTIGDKSDSTTLKGEASVITESMEIYADSITMSGEDYRYIEASGNVKGVNTEAELEFSCGKLRYDRETKIADLSEKVSLKDTKNDVQANAQVIQYNQESDIAVMQIDIELTQKDNVCTGVYAVYRKKDQILDLSGNAQIKQGSDTFRAQEISLDLDSQEITLDGRVKGSIVDERKTENSSETENTSENAATSEEENASLENQESSETNETFKNAEESIANSEEPSLKTETDEKTEDPSESQESFKAQDGSSSNADAQENQEDSSVQKSSGNRRNGKRRR